jgi:CRISPR-associated protein Csd1
MATQPQLCDRSSSRRGARATTCSSSATPALVLGRLIRNAQIGHLPKIDAGLRIWFEKQLAEVWNKLQQRPPEVLDLEGQTLFAMGYYQQNAQAYQSQKTDAADNGAVAEPPQSDQ